MCCHIWERKSANFLNVSRECLVNPFSHLSNKMPIFRTVSFFCNIHYVVMTARLDIVFKDFDICLHKYYIVNNSEPWLMLTACLFCVLQLLINSSKSGERMTASLRKPYLDTNLWVSQILIFTTAAFMFFGVCFKGCDCFCLKYSPSSQVEWNMIHLLVIQSHNLLDVSQYIAISEFYFTALGYFSIN